MPVGAVVVCKDRIIARAHNLTETLTDVTAHAEMQAITAAASTLGGKHRSSSGTYQNGGGSYQSGGGYSFSGGNQQQNTASQAHEEAASSGNDIHRKHKKLFSKDEGEYVDFEEIKE